MSIWEKLTVNPALPIAALVTFGLIACATSKPQVPVAAASPSAQPTAQSAQAAQKKTHKKMASRHKTKAGAVVASKASKSGPELATTIEPATTPATASLSKGNTASVLSRLHRDDLTEIARAKVAEAKTTSPEVRSYADQLISDHMAVDQTVVDMAQKAGVQLTEAPAAGAENSATTKASGNPAAVNNKKSDENFLKQANSDHERLISKLKKEREDASNDEIEALIDRVVPILQQDQELARILMSKEQAS